MYMHFTLLAHCFMLGIFTVTFTPKAAVLFPSGNVIFTCNDSNSFWVINETANRLDDVEVEMINGLSVDGAMLIITQSANNTLYGCGIFTGTFFTDTGILYVAGMCFDSL